MLLGRYSVLSKHPGRDIGGGAIGLGMNRADYNKPTMMRAAFGHVNWDAHSAIPDGARPPVAWVMANTSGGMAARGNIYGTGAFTATGAMGVGAEAALSGSGALTATGALIVSAVAALSGSGSITTADAVGIANAVAALAGTGAITTADVAAIGHLLSSLSGSGSVASLITAIGHMEATIELGASVELTAAAVAAEVWGALAASFNAAGTMGEKMNDAGSASNPWTEVIEGSFTAAELLRLIAASAAGATTGAGTTTFTIIGVDEVTDRIIATVTPEGNRTATLLDGS